MTPLHRRRRSPHVRIATHPERYDACACDPDGAVRAPLDPVTMVVSCAVPPPAAEPEQAALLRLCARPRAVVEIAAHLRLTCAAVTVLLTELLAAGLVRTRAPAPHSARWDPELLDAVMDRLQEL